ncbi:U6 snRNA-associated SM-like protein LSM7 [Cryptosporidium andersoni]|uniref:U6 snRNA-associated SM-like protein LSM7 n=1 Tax=Cryptosporidium andersoni TaxID=117008 RepID=A0A1J4MGM3_9CRYT|nr:U6 snRNA-associated SM-like protein LSM7 [Cryptosporidium andersoni]
MSSKSILDLSKFLNKEIRVKICGGRDVTGILRGYDGVTNIVLDDTKEFLLDLTNTTSEQRDLGLLVVRGTSILMIAPLDGSEYIENPFVNNT